MANELISDLYANVVGNAIKHSRGPLQIEIGLDKVQEDGRNNCRVTIEDAGPGIAGDMKKMLSMRQCMPGTRYAGKGLWLCPVRIRKSDHDDRSTHLN